MALRRQNQSGQSGGGGGGFGWGGGWSWVLYGLIAAMIIIGMLRAQSGEIADWEKCKESLIQQMFSDTCTPRERFRDRTITIAPEGRDI